MFQGLTGHMLLIVDDDDGANDDDDDDCDDDDQVVILEKYAMQYKDKTRGVCFKG